MSPDVVPETSGRRLTPVQSRAVVMLAEGKRTDQVARETGKSQRTIQRWLAEDDLFRDALDGLQDEIVKASLRHLKATAEWAARAMVSFMVFGKADDSVRIRAGAEALDHRHCRLDSIRMTSRPEAIGVSAEAMGQLRKAVGEFNSWRFYDCHETLEDVWREMGGKSGRMVPERGADPDPAPRGRLKPRQGGGQASAAPGDVADFLQGIIKAAAGFHHVLRGNHKGAVNLLSDSLRLLEAYRPECLAIDVERLVVEVEACLGRIEELGAERLEEFERGMIPRIEWVDVIGH